MQCNACGLVLSAYRAPLGLADTLFGRVSKDSDACRLLTASECPAVALSPRTLLARRGR